MWNLCIGEMRYSRTSSRRKFSKKATQRRSANIGYNMRTHTIRNVGSVLWRTQSQQRTTSCVLYTRENVGQESRSKMGGSQTLEALPLWSWSACRKKIVKFFQTLNGCAMWRTYKDQEDAQFSQRVEPSSTVGPSCRCVRSNLEV